MDGRTKGWINKWMDGWMWLGAGEWLADLMAGSMDGQVLGCNYADGWINVAVC